jgi:uncharacterized protein (TIGR02646 family)
MIRLDLSSVQPTDRLRKDQAALAGRSDADGPDCVEARGSAGWGSLRDELCRLQHWKCAYCEDYVAERDNEIDHIRPKDRDQYWWLAFSVSNLLLACRNCNNFKSNHWELQAGATKLTPRQEPWAVVEPAMLVDPSREDPSPHICYLFSGGEWRIAPRSDRGRWTIATLELDRMSFRREANEWVAEAIHPQIRELRCFESGRDKKGIDRVINDLVGLTRTQHKWSQLATTVVGAIRAGDYP